MKESAGNLWGFVGRAVIAVTTSGSVARDGRAVLGNGCARQAGERDPGLAGRLGALIRSGGNHVHELGSGLVSFPVEESAWSLPDLTLIARSARELRALADEKGWTAVVVPRPGCGGGGLPWPVARPLLAPHFDDRFEVVTQPAG
jgi:hypothetical protein